MKNEKLYEHYLYFIKDKLDNNRLSIGEYSLLRISRDYFEYFKSKYDKNECFQDEIMEIYRRETRNKKIENLIKK